MPEAALRLGDTLSHKNHNVIAINKPMSQTEQLQASDTAQTV